MAGLVTRRSASGGGSLGAWRAALRARPRVFRRAPERLSALRPPLVGVSEAKRQSPDAAMRARERDGLFDMVKNAASDGRPHPEERACDKGCANANLRARVSKDEDEPLRAPSCFETHRSAVRRRQRLRSRRAAMLLSMRARRRRAFWPNEPNCDFGQTNPSPGSPPAPRGRRPGRRPLGLEHQPLAVGNDRPLGFPVSGLFFTVNREL